jgi:trk system potassium uptake protein
MDSPAAHNPAAPRPTNPTQVPISRVMGLRVISRLLGMLLVVLGIAMLVCLGWTVYYGENQTSLAFINATAITLASGGICSLWGRKSRKTIYRREALAVVGLGWILIGAYGALPYLFTGTFTNFADAYFEATSGFTTTGATVIADIDAVTHGVLFWRMLTHWLGGMGIIVLFTALFAHLGVGAKQLFRSETPGPITENLRPTIKESALTMWKIYTGLTLILTLALLACGMDFFDAICHAFATMATGGYSTRNQSVGYYDSAAIELVILFFMFVAGVNFTLYYQALRGNWRGLVRNSEFRVYGGIALFASLVIALDIHQTRHPDLLQALRFASFQTVSILTTTGFGTDDFATYPTLSKFILICLMFVGGCAGSTSGGMKVSRLMVLFKIAYQEVYRAFRPQVQMSVRIGRMVVRRDIAHSILTFGFMFFFFFAAGSLFMSALGLDLATATTSVIACLGNIGPGLSRVGPTHTYAEIPAVGKIFLSFCMLLGRLELTTLLVLLLPAFWKRIVRE